MLAGTPRISGPVTAGGGGTVTSISTTAPITGGPITTTGTIGITQSTTSTDGYLSSTDWNTFNGKLSPVLTQGHFFVGNSSDIAVDAGTGILWDATFKNLTIDSTGSGAIPIEVTSAGNTTFGVTSSSGQAILNLLPSGSNDSFVTYRTNLVFGTNGGLGGMITDLFSMDNAGNFTAGVTGNAQGTLRIVGQTSGVIGITTDTNAGTYDLVLPTALGGNPAHPWVLVDPLGDGHLAFVDPSIFSPTLIQNQIAYGDSSNLITSSSQLLFDPTSRFSVQFTYNSVPNSAFIDAQPGSGIVSLGDINGSDHLTTFQVNDNPGIGSPSITATVDGIFQVQDTSGNPWLQVRPIAGNVDIGDISISSTGLMGAYDALANNYSLYSTYNSVSSSLLEQIDAANSVWKWGDLSNAKNGTKLQLNDDDRTLTYSATAGNNPFFKVDLTNNDSITGDFDDTITGFYTNTDWANHIFTVQNQLDNYLTVNVLGGVYSLGPIATTGAGFKFDAGNGNTNAYVQGPSYGFQVIDSGNSGLPSANFSTSLSQIGDIAGIGTGTVFNVDPIGGLIESHVSGQFNVFDATTHKYISIDPSGGNSFFGPFSVSGLDQGLWVDTNAQINSLKSPGGTNITNTLGDIYFGVDIQNKALLMPNTIVESVDAEPYGSTINLAAGMAGENMVTFGPSGGGASTINLPTGTNAYVGTRFTASDLGGAVAANNVTIDAGTGNTITGTGGTAQTFILNTNGTSVTLIKATSTKWMII